MPRSIFNAAVFYACLYHTGVEPERDTNRVSSGLAGMYDRKRRNQDTV